MRARRPVLLAAAAAGVAVTYVAVADPGQAERLPTAPCPFHAVTGWWCPGCGITRAAHDVITGDVVGAFGAHALWPLVLGLLAWTGAAWLTPRVPSPARAPAAVWVAAVALAVAFAVARNTPAFATLAP